MTYPEPPVPETLPGSLKVRQHAIEVVEIAATIAYMAAGLFVAATLTFGPARLHQSDSMRLVAGLGVPWPVWGAVYLLFALALTNHVTRVGGWALGLFLVLFFLTSYADAVSHGSNGSAPGFFASFAAVISTATAVIRSISAEEWRPTKQRP